MSYALKHVYHHLSDPAHMTLGDGTIYHQYGSTLGRFLFTSLERHITIAGVDVWVAGCYFTNPNGCCVEVLPSTYNVGIEGNVMVSA